jgi:hypothetical protein
MQNGFNYTKLLLTKLGHNYYNGLPCKNEWTDQSR